MVNNIDLNQWRSTSKRRQNAWISSLFVKNQWSIPLLTVTSKMSCVELEIRGNIKGTPNFISSKRKRTGTCVKRSMLQNSIWPAIWRVLVAVPWGRCPALKREDPMVVPLFALPELSVVFCLLMQQTGTWRAKIDRWGHQRLRQTLKHTKAKITRPRCNLDVYIYIYTCTYTCMYIIEIVAAQGDGRRALD